MSEAAVTMDARLVDASVVRALLARLHGPGFSVCLLHTGVESASGQWSGDIDLLVGGDLRAFFRTIRTSAAALGLSPALHAQRVFNTVEIDLLFPGATSWTVVFADRDGTILNVDVAAIPGSIPATDAGAFGVPEAARELLIPYLVVKRLRKGDRSPEPWARISAQGPAPDLTPLLGAELAGDVSDALASRRAPEPATVARAQRVLRRRRVVTLAAVRSLVRAAPVAAQRSLRPAGAFVSFGGVDGSGKTAATEALLAWSPFRRVRRLHSRPGVLRPPGSFVGRQPSDGSAPHEQPPWGPAMSALRLLYFWVDFVLGYWVRVWPIKARGGLVVSERWWWDMYVDPGRHRLSPMPRAARLLGRAVPQPDPFLLLDAPSARILERKRELDAAEIDRQRAAWARLPVPHMRKIDAAAPLDEVVRAVNGAVLERRHLVTFPKADPRWVVDPSDPESMRAALRLYIPSRRRARAAARAAETLLHRLPAAVLTRFTGDPAPEAQRAIEWVREAAGRQRVAAYLGSPGPLQKVSAVVLDDDGEPVLFAKVAATEAAASALRNEAVALDQVRSIAPSVVVPNVAGLEEDDRGALLLLTPVLGSRFDNRAAPTEQHARLLAELHEARRPFDGAERRDALEERLDGAAGYGDFLRAALHETVALWPAVRSAHFSHGDLTAWNCLDCGRAIGVVDWESAGYRIPGWDAIHYLVQIEAITRFDDPAAAAERILRAPFLIRAGSVVTATADVDLPETERWRALQLLNLIESAVTLLCEQPDLSQRGVGVRAHVIARLLGMAKP